MFMSKLSMEEEELEELEEGVILVGAGGGVRSPLRKSNTLLLALVLPVLVLVLVYAGCTWAGGKGEGEE